MHHVLLTSIGRRSGNPHTVCLPYWLDADENQVVVASFSGAPKSPAWFHNVADRSANPTVEVQDRARRYIALAEVLDGDDYATTWAALTADRPFFADYQARTERRIPLVRLMEQRPTSPPDDL
jgi:deazaflavin-dependent oxidoreductase (nitroreductase family)